MLSPAVDSDYSCGQAITRHANMDWAFDANLSGSLLWQNQKQSNKSGSYNLWEYYKDTGQYKAYSPQVMGVIPTPYTTRQSATTSKISRALGVVRAPRTHPCPQCPHLYDVHPTRNESKKGGRGGREGGSGGKVGREGGRVEREGGRGWVQATGQEG